MNESGCVFTSLTVFLHAMTHVSTRWPLHPAVTLPWAVRASLIQPELITAVWFWFRRGENLRTPPWCYCEVMSTIKRILVIKIHIISSCSCDPIYSGITHQWQRGMLHKIEVRELFFLAVVIWRLNRENASQWEIRKKGGTVKKKQKKKRSAWVQCVLSPVWGSGLHYMLLCTPLSAVLTQYLDDFAQLPCRRSQVK